ncbi:MAG: hypothetical protein KQA41_02165 [Candidatus Aenigmarchaeota archaeon]|nr:hypothetical protein [Candidatus Aenigmarchaeota archaeon]MBU5689006.1 hypothetical protein [Candidatus Aenigmarchaeota archaeon]
MEFSKKGETDYISIFFLAAIFISTIIVIFLTVPGLYEFFIEFSSSIFTSIIVLAVGSFIIIFGVILAGTNIRVGKTLAYIGVATLIVGFLIIEMAYVSKSKESLKTPMTERCSGSGRVFRGANAADFVTCIITGYRYGGDYGTWAFFGFWVFGVIVPLLLFMSLFYDFVDASGVVRQPKSKKIVGYSLGLIAYRGFAVTNLLEILSLGTLGIALIALNLIFLGGLLAYIHRVFERWKPIEHAIGIARAGANSRRILKDYTKAAIRAAKEGDEHALLDILDSMEHIATRIDWLNIIKQSKNDAIQGKYNDIINNLQRLENSLNNPSQTA